MKKIIALAITVLLVVSVTGCTKASSMQEEYDIIGTIEVVVETQQQEAPAIMVKSTESSPIHERILVIFTEGTQIKKGSKLLKVEDLEEGMEVSVVIDKTTIRKSLPIQADGKLIIVK